MHFFEALERKIDFQKEFNKIEDMVIRDRVRAGYGDPNTVHLWMALNFKKWERRGNFTTIEELRDHLHFSYVKSGLGTAYAWNIDINRFFLYCEMIINLYIGLKKYSTTGIDEQMKYILDNIENDVERSGFEIKEVNNEIMIVEKNPIAVEVADCLPNISDIIIEYNHYLLKGNIRRKQEILKQIADAIEPMRKDLEAICKTETSDFFFMVNNMNIRHNNCDPNDTTKYREEFATLSNQDKEEWYDIVYEQALALVVFQKQKDRNKKIKVYKQNNRE